MAEHSASGLGSGGSLTGRLKRRQGARAEAARCFTSWRRKRVGSPLRPLGKAAQRLPGTPEEAGERQHRGAPGAEMRCRRSGGHSPAGSAARGPSAQTGLSRGTAPAHSARLTRKELRGCPAWCPGPSPLEVSAPSRPHRGGCGRRSSPGASLPVAPQRLRAARRVTRPTSCLRPPRASVPRQKEEARGFLVT